MIARHLFISGLVQGVGFRFFAQRAAARYQVRGYVRNLPDGRVEAWAEGQSSAVMAFKDDLSAGPAHSQVDMVEEIVVDPAGTYANFRVEK